ncbi:MAG: hypothetical protein EXR69_15390 [Myxococcales bacterium]|nr:hypothetical protein [Myxococcales bacterium]
MPILLSPSSFSLAVRLAVPLSVSLLSRVAWAGVYSSPPEGVRQVTLLVCPTNPDCELEADWVAEARPDDHLVSVDSLLSLNVIQGGDNESRAETFSRALDAALAAAKQEEWTAATRQLDEAQRALAGWTGVPENQRLFDLYYLRATVKLAVSKQAEGAFEQAAAVAWNRTVTLPLDVEPYTSLYYKALYNLLNEGLGGVQLNAVPGARYFLDGVELGEGPITLSVYAGHHRINAVRGGTNQQWRTSLKVQAFRTSAATARPASTDDLGWLAAGMVQAVEERTLEPDLATLLRDWCAHYDITGVRILVAEPAFDPLALPGEPTMGVNLRAVAYDPKLKRFSEE